MILKEYELFVEVIDGGSLSAAARTLRISPATASKQIAKMEARLGVRLLNRTTRQVLPTEIGEQFYERAAAVLHAAREAEALAAGRSRSPSGRLRVTCPTSLARIHLAPVFAGFVDRHPDLQLEIEATDALVPIVADRIDLAIRITDHVEPGHMAEDIAANRRVLCAAPSYLADYDAPADLHELDRHHLLAATHQLPWRLHGPAGPVLHHGRSRIATNSSELVREFALAGLGIALRSVWDVATHLRAGDLRVILPRYSGSPDVRIQAVYPATRYVSPNVRGLIDHLRGELGPRPPWDREGAAS